MPAEEEMEVDPPAADNAGDEVDAGEGEARSIGTCQLPFARVKRIMKSDPDVTNVSHETVFMVSKATELFIEFVAKEAFNKSKGERRKTVQYKDLASTVSELEQLEFLSWTVPKQVPARNALAAIKAKKTKPAGGEDSAAEAAPAVDGEMEQ